MPNHTRALELLEQLATIDLPVHDRQAIERLASSIRLPMIVVLAKVPGETLALKATRIGVSRQEVWRWSKGLCRPKKKQALRLHKLTGFPASSIYGE